MHNKIFYGLVIGMTGVVLCADASAQAPIPREQYPIRPIRLIVLYAPGGDVDIVARTLAQELTRRMGQQIIVDNRAIGVPLGSWRAIGVRLG